MVIPGPTPPREGAQNARTSMENRSDGTFFFGLLAVAVVIGLIIAALFLIPQPSNDIPSDSQPTNLGG